MRNRQTAREYKLRTFAAGRKYFPVGGANKAITDDYLRHRIAICPIVAQPHLYIYGGTGIRLD